MEAGGLRHKISIQKPRTTTNITGERTETWDEVAVCWADIRPVRGRDLRDSDHPITAYDVVVWMRPVLRFKLDATHRLVWLIKNRVYEIVAVVDGEERARMLEVRCLQGASLG